MLTALAQYSISGSGTQIRGGALLFSETGPGRVNLIHNHFCLQTPPNTHIILEHFLHVHLHLESLSLPSFLTDCMFTKLHKVHLHLDYSGFCVFRALILLTILYELGRPYNTKLGVVLGQLLTSQLGDGILAECVDYVKVRPRYGKFACNLFSHL